MKPEKTKHFCVLPWVRATLTHWGEFSVCCHTWPELRGSRPGPIGIEGERRSKVLGKMRASLLRDEPSPHCSHCYRLEEVGHASPRKSANQTFAEEAAGILADQEAEPLSVRSLDVRFSNVCNLKCRTCGPHSSTSWLADAAALGNPVSPETLRLGKVSPEFEKYAHAILPGIKQVYFAGGEPLLEEAHYRLLERLLELGKSDVILDYNSNLSVLGLGKRDILSLWRRFDTVSVGASFDGSGPQFDYLRKGAEWSLALANYRRVLREAPHVSIFIHPTVSVMNAFHLPRAIGDWMREGLLQWPGQLVVNPLDEPHYLSATLLNEEERANLRASFQSFLNDLKCNSLLRLGIKGVLNTVLNHIERVQYGPEQALLRERFREVTRALDQRRSEELTTVFPELSGLMSSESGRSMDRDSFIQAPLKEGTRSRASPPHTQGERCRPAGE